MGASCCKLIGTGQVEKEPLHNPNTPGVSEEVSPAKRHLHVSQDSVSALVVLPDGEKAHNSGVVVLDESKVANRRPSHRRQTSILPQRVKVSPEVRDMVLGENTRSLVKASIEDSLAQLFADLDSETKHGTVRRSQLTDFARSVGLGEAAGKSLAEALGLKNDEMEYTQTQFTKSFHRLLNFMSTKRSTVNQQLYDMHVFLGGACNPTTWREDVAIPALEKAKVTYYNPQVKDWHDSLFVLENLMKALSRVLLFVIDGSTRGIFSMIEASQFICEGRNVVLVVQEVEVGVEYSGHSVDKAQAKDLNRARKYLCGLAKTYHVPTFDTIEEAVQEVIRTYRRPVLLTPHAVPEEDEEDIGEDVE